MNQNITPKLVTREQYVEMLIDSSFQDASEMEQGFMSWCQKHTPIWREMGHDEMWIRQRIESARITRHVHHQLKEQGLTMLEIREALRRSYADYPQLYDLAVARERLYPGLLQYRGDAYDLRHRYTLRVLLHEADKRAYAACCRWEDRPEPDPEKGGIEQPEQWCVKRDLSTVEELQQGLALCNYLISLLEVPAKLTSDQITTRMYEHGQRLRDVFIEKYGYLPEESTIPYIPVTIEGPQDHDVYYVGISSQQV